LIPVSARRPGCMQGRSTPAGTSAPPEGGVKTAGKLLRGGGARQPARPPGELRGEARRAPHSALAGDSRA
jgi:hypothetical protein